MTWLILLAYAMAAGAIFYAVALTDRRVFRRRTYDFAAAARRFSLALTRMNKAMALLGVSAAEVNAALKKFGVAYSQERKPE